MRQRNPGEPSRRPDSMVLQILLAAGSILVSLLLLFVPQLKISVLCYAFCAGMIAAGVGLIVAFFLSEGYKQLHSYNFSVGTLLIILACCGLLRNAELTEQFEFFAGIVALVMAVFVLQNTVQLKVLRSGLWAFELVLTVIALVAAILVLCDVKPILAKLPSFPFWVLLVNGGLSLIGLLLASIGILQASHRAKQEVPPVVVAGTVPVAGTVSMTGAAPVVGVAPVAPVSVAPARSPEPPQEPETPSESTPANLE